MDIDRGTLDGTLMDRSQKPLSSPAECLVRLLHTEEYADLTIILPGTEKTFKVHRLVLAMWSPVFKAMLFGPMSEGDSINLPDDNPEAFKWMLKYMYSGYTKLPSVDVAIHVYMLSDKYQMDHLNITCSKYLMDSVSAVSVPQVMNLATLLEDNPLLKRCSVILETSPDDVFSSPSIGLLTSKCLQQILSLDMPISSETIIFQGLLTWGRTQLKNGDEDITHANLRQKIEHILPQIRFLAMTSDELVKNVLPEYIFTIEEATPILQIVNGVQGLEIPKACSSIMKRRERLRMCRLSPAKTLFAYRTGKFHGEGKERNLLSAIKCKTVIYLSKLEYVKDINDRGQLLVRDSTGLEIDTAVFDGKKAVFEKKLKLIPEQEYSFVLKGIAKMLPYYITSIIDNEVISGSMGNSCQSSINIYYCK